ncbi:Cytochrome c [Enhygromyxa salina]|uniref:Cytochrome c n=1 Tax=Enhygromyxa salina TaxID=215803 RepID=A0A2S9XXC4_9BACT|nr:c-type cytochrome [Enhygromyxa salina]PRP97518.1 Cytochrome c [Enhygromyxa salina]
MRGPLQYSVTSLLFTQALFTLACSTPPDGSADSNASSEDGEGTAGESETSDTGPASCVDADGPWDAGYAIEGPDIPAGDPEQGLWALVHQDYVNCGIPYDLFVTAAEFVAQLQNEPLPWRDGKAAELPYDWNLVVSEGGTELVASNCLTCHADYFNDELILGLGRHTADYTEDFGAFAGLLPMLEEGTDAALELEKFRERTETLAPHVQTYTVGSNPADVIAIVLSAHRDPETLAWSSEALNPLDPPMIVADTPPWWRVKKKAGHFANGMSRGDHRGSMMFASSLCVDSVEQAEQMLDYFSDIRAYIASIEAPRYPWAIDEQLAAEGEEIFTCDCAGCHGSYSQDPEAETYPNLLIPLDIIATDPVTAQLAASGEGSGQQVEWFNSSWYGQFTELRPAAPFIGYVAPPLDGIWATAPFFHNGSAPSLAAVLDSSARPRYWRRATYDSTDFDRDQLGWRFVELDYGQAEASDTERKHIYDTTILAHGNGGHTFGDHLDDGQRAAVLEYLKTL